MSHRLVGIISWGLVALTAVLLWSRILSPSDGSVVQLSNEPWRADRMTISFILDDTTGLRDGDLVTAVDGHSLSPVWREIRKDDYVTYTVIRDGALHQVTVRIGDFPVRGFLAYAWPSLLVLLTLLAIAVLVFRKRPADPAAQALLLIGTLAFCGGTAWLLGDQAFNLAIEGPSLLDFAGELALALVWGAVAHFALVAPGTGLKATWRRLLAVYCLPLALHGAYLAVSLPAARNSFEATGRLVQVSLPPSSVLPIGAALLMLLSYRSTRDAASRRRLRWLLVMFFSAASAWLIVWIVPNAIGWPAPPENLISLLFLLPTLALGAAILRYRLFDIEVILRRSLLYGSLTVCVLGIYLASAWLLSYLLGPRPGLVALLGSGLVAISAPPLLSYLHRRVGRLIYGERDDPYEVISRLGQIDAAADPRLVLQNVAQTLAHTLRLPMVSIELRAPRSRFAIEASYGRMDGTAISLPLSLGADVLGCLVLAVSPGREPFGPADKRLLDTLARQVSSAASTVLLTTELQLSREQIVVAREEERRRLHHRLHDGLGPNLAAAAMQMEVTKTLLRRDPDRAEALLDAQIAATRELIGDVRGLVYNLRPPALDQLGLAGALRERATYLAQPNADALGASRIVVEEIGDMDNLPAAVEVAAFWIGIEAVSNAVRHGQAPTCRIQLTRNAHLSIEICDDGQGLPDRVTAGGGLISMRERAEELGGTCTVQRNGGNGTIVQAHLPIRGRDIE